MTVYTWSASLSVQVDDVVKPTASQVNGYFFLVTTAGTTGTSEPNWPVIINEDVNDNNVVYKSISALYDEISNINPSAIIELFTLELKEKLHYPDGIPAGLDTVYRFHAGSNLNSNAEIVWAGNTYQRFPLIAEGFAYQRGQLPRPKLIVSNALGTITAILDLIKPNDLTGATITRIRTLARFLDAVNFAPIGNNPPANPFGTPDPLAEFPREIYAIDRKANENREVVEFELAAAFDLIGVKSPKRQCTRSLFPSLGSFA